MSASILLLGRELHGRRLHIEDVRKLTSEQVNVADILDVDDGMLKRCIMLGFTRDGRHLLTYTEFETSASDYSPGISVQLWTFIPGQKSRRLWTRPVFPGCSHHRHAFLEGDLSLTISETIDSSMLVCHGYFQGPMDESYQHISILPGPALPCMHSVHALHLRLPAAGGEAPVVVEEERPQMGGFESPKTIVIKSLSTFRCIEVCLSELLPGGLGWLHCNASFDAEASTFAAATVTEFAAFVSMQKTLGPRACWSYDEDPHGHILRPDGDFISKFEGADLKSSCLSATTAPITPNLWLSRQEAVAMSCLSWHHQNEFVPTQYFGSMDTRPSNAAGQTGGSSTQQQQRPDRHPRVQLCARFSRFEMDLEKVLERHVLKPFGLSARHIDDFYGLHFPTHRLPADAYSDSLHKLVDTDVMQIARLSTAPVLSPILESTSGFLVVVVVQLKPSEVVEGPDPREIFGGLQVHYVIHIPRCGPTLAHVIHMFTREDVRLGNDDSDDTNDAVFGDNAFYSPELRFEWFLLQMAERFGSPLPAHRIPHVINNASVRRLLRSLPFLRHQTLPLVLCGFKKKPGLLPRPRE